MKKNIKSYSRLGWVVLLTLILVPGLLTAQDTAEEPDVVTEQAAESDEAEASESSAASREEMALDSTATQWSFQMAWQGMTYHDDTLDDGTTRPAGNDDFAQLRIVAPFAFKSFTLLPRVTIRHYENPQGESGFGNTEIFALLIPKSWDWGSGRFGIGPLITAPGSEKVAKDEWGYGFAVAAVNGKGKWFYGALITQSWQSTIPEVIPAGSSNTNPLGIAPFLNYRLGGGWYVGNGDMVLRYNWDKSELYVPIGVRVGKVFVNDKSSWNLYAEYQTSLYKSDWSGSAVDNSFRINLTYTIPVG